MATAMFICSRCLRHSSQHIRPGYRRSAPLSTSFAFSTSPASTSSSISSSQQRFVRPQLRLRSRQSAYAAPQRHPIARDSNITTSIQPLNARGYSTSPGNTNNGSNPPKSRTPSFDREVAQLASLPLHPLTLSDLVRFGKPPLSPPLLLSSAAFTLRVLPIRLARRILSLRNLPYIVVSNPHISQIYNNYLHSLRLLLSFPKDNFPSNLKEESRFNDVLAEIVDTHKNTIPALARGFSECKRYINPELTTQFLEEHLRARIGTRLLAEQHLALHDASISQDGRALPGVAHDGGTTWIGTIDTHLSPTKIVKECAEFVGDICDLRYGQRPRVVVDGMTDTEFAYVPGHLEYVLTELLKNAFRAVVESGNVDDPIIVTIASAELERESGAEESGSDSDSDDEGRRRGRKSRGGSSGGYNLGGQLDSGSGEGMGIVRPGTEVQGDGLREGMLGAYAGGNGGAYPGGSRDESGMDTMKAEAARAVTIRIRDRGGGIAPEHLNKIFSYSFTTFNNANTLGGGGGGYTSNVSGGGGGGMDAISSAMMDVEGSTIAGLGFGMGLSRSYAQFFGGDLKVESLFGWGTDVYLGLRGLDVDRR